jgi:hypothetical protein
VIEPSLGLVSDPFDLPCEAIGDGTFGKHVIEEPASHMQSAGLIMDAGDPFCAHVSQDRAKVHVARDLLASGLASHADLPMHMAIKISVNQCVVRSS